jgi:hypothetical protein
MNLPSYVVPDQETQRLPVRPALFKQRTGVLVVRWVTVDLLFLLTKSGKRVNTSTT